MVLAMNQMSIVVTRQGADSFPKRECVGDADAFKFLVSLMADLLGMTFGKNPTIAGESTKTWTSEQYLGQSLNCWRSLG